MSNFAKRIGMRPLLMLDGVRDLHDARYCAAIGIGLLGFQLEGAHALRPAAVKEIVEWLSGPEAIGNFGFSPAAAIAETAQEASLSRLRIPVDFAPDEAAALPLPLIFEADDTTESERMLLLAKRFSNAVFSFSASNTDQMQAMAGANLMSRCLLRCDAPDAVWKQLKHEGQQPFGFLLGSFTEDKEGLLDYDVCDDFITKYEDLVPA